MTKISDVIKDLKKSQSATYHRGKSWEHCYEFFRNYRKFRNNDELLDCAALHLGFFLASWGMLRGSSFLLQKDYKFYVSLIKILIDPKYDRLWNFDFSEKSIKQNIVLLFNLKEKLRKKIIENNKADEDNKEHQTDLIITKITMATMGCTPSYDRYLKEGLRKMGRGLDNFNENSFKNLFKLSKKNEELLKIYKKVIFIKGSKIKYPPMKLLDLYFWLLGQPKN